MTKLTLQIGNRILSAQDPDEDLTYSDIISMFAGLMVGHSFNEDALMKEMSEYGTT